MLTVLFNVSLAVYVAALVSAVIGLITGQRALRTGGTVLLAAGMLVQTLYIAGRWHEAGRAPFSNMFESLVLFVWALVLVYLVVQLRIRLPAVDAAVALLAVLALAAASTFETEIKPLMPALQSNWLSVHVFTCFLGYAGFAISFVAAVGYLVAARSASSAQPATLDALETIVARTISFGFLFLTLGIVTGAVWANSAWGTYWSWDPKETWSLITWLIYAAFLHCRYMRGWRDKRAAWVSIIGFISVLFTYFGVNLLLSGLHSYA